MSAIRVLLIEDDPSLAKVLIRRLSTLPSVKLEMVWADRLSAALENLKQQKFDAMVSDLKLPDAEGLQIIDQLIANAPDIPIVVLTGTYEDEKVALEALRRGVQDYLVKDQMDIREVGRAVRYAIERKLLQKRLTERTTELVQAIKDLREEITQREIAEKALQEAYTQLEQTQRELIQAEKLAALGRFSAGVAHEIKNPLGIILGGIEFLEDVLPKDQEKIQTAAVAIKEGVQRADTIVQGLLKFSTPGLLTAQQLRPEEVVREALALIQYRFQKPEISIHTEFEEGALWIQADKTQLQQVLFNLFGNAVDAMPQGGSLTIKTYTSPSGSKLKTHCVIEVADTGMGIPKENLSRLFEPFFTTKRDSKGTGLGLSVSRMIIENHRGRLIVGSEPGQGTVVKVFLPLDYQAPPNKKSNESTPQESRRILP